MFRLSSNHRLEDFRSADRNLPRMKPMHVDTDTDKGEMVDCEECGVKLEIVGLDPVELISLKREIRRR